jgi:predicted ATP-dependent endonuclease of OLD family
MAMYISELRIRHFRNFLNTKFTFCKGVNTLIGENGSGKTNAFFALRLLLDDALSRNAIYLKETDFCRALGNWQGHWIIIAIHFEELDCSEGCQLLKHGTGHMDGTETGTFTFYFRPKLEIRKKLYEMALISIDNDDIQQYLKEITIDDYEPVFTGRATADFFDDEIYHQIAGDFTSFTFPDPKDDDQELLGVRMGSIHSEITCTFAQALRDVISDLRGFRSNPLLDLLRGKESSIQIEDADRITSVVAQLNKDISALPEVKSISDGIQSTLHSTVGYTYSPLVNVESSLPDRIDKLLQRLTITVGDDLNSTYKGDLSEQSLGGANLIYLALKLLEYELKLSSDRVAHFLLIEEPEAHIHTHIQKTLFENQSARRTQVIVSTHSTHISSVAKIRSVNVLARRKDYADVYQPAKGLDKETAERVERYLDAVRSTLLFAKGVILVEGEAELVMIPAMIRAIFGLSPDEMGISVISMDSAFFEHVAVIFHNDRIRRKCAIITDLDKTLIQLPQNEEDDNVEQRHARNAQEVGEQRYQSLEFFIQNNPWINAFYAKHTFEVDFLTTDNVREVGEVVDALYKRDGDRKRVKAMINSDDPSISGVEILRLAEKTGKGWFALLLSEKLHVDTFIPEYILCAIAFATDNTPLEAFKRIGLYRITNDYFDEALSKKFPDTKELERMLPQEFISLYKKIARNDQLSKLMRYMEEFTIDDPA